MKGVMTLSHTLKLWSLGAVVMLWASPQPNTLSLDLSCCRDISAATGVRLTLIVIELSAA